ncbi:MAG: acetyl-CoA carboxylase carboxyl transferase subunit alpha, partial [Candidatus Omnitrophica bacterium]|nr:acetyl-CoA carboxylase carboxyl transferase subunit alpha [Candidatus Omnitrophota bacterium]
MAVILDFEKPILELERKIEELKTLSRDKKMDLNDEIKRF